MAIGNKPHIDLCPDHEKLSRIRDIEFPNTVRGYRKPESSYKPFGLTQSEIDEILGPSPKKRTPEHGENTQFYDKDFRRV